MGQRSRYTSKGWWAYQGRRLTATVLAAPATLTTLYRKRFPKRLTDQEQWDRWATDVERIQDYITEVFRHRLMFREITELDAGNVERDRFAYGASTEGTVIKTQH